MSLQVWLPLTGHLNNQGLVTLPSPTLNTMTYPDGKLGKCGYGGCGYHLTNEILGNQWSIALWYCRVGNFPTGNAIIFCKNINSATDSQIYFSIASSGQAFNITINSSSSVTHNYTFSKNTWYHLVATYDGVNVKMYINGTLVKTGSVTTAMQTNALNIFVNCRSNATAGTEWTTINDQKVNDVRLYDHALSEKEVKELSKGLILHYPLTGGGRGNANLLKNSNFLQGADGLEGYTVNATSATKQTDCMKVVSSANNKGIYSSNYDEITTGTITTFSAYVKADTAMTIYIGVDGSYIANCQAYTIGTNWQRISITKAKTTDNSIPRIYGNGTFYIKLLKYELGDEITSWMPNSADAAYAVMGYDSTIEYDVSGYNYHGTKNGTIIYSSDSARYAVCSNFNGTDSYIEAEPLPASTTTISLWLKTTWDKPPGGSNVYKLVLQDKFTGLAIGFSSNGYYMVSYTGVNTGGTGSNANTANLYQANKWNHIVVIKTGSTTRTVYINGQLAPTGTNSNWGCDIDKLFIGCRHHDGVYKNYFDGQISDLRIYATALTADDVKELYNTAASLANNGTLFAYDFVEV